MEIPTKAIVGQVAFLPNQVLLVVHPTRTTEETSTKASSTGWVLEALDLQGLMGWLYLEQKQAAAQMGAPVCAH